MPVITDIRSGVYQEAVSEWIGTSQTTGTHDDYEPGTRGSGDSWTSYENPGSQSFVYSSASWRSQQKVYSGITNAYPPYYKLAFICKL